MRIKQLSLLVCSIIIALFVVISYVTSELVVSRGIDAIESKQASASMTLLRNYLHAAETQIDELAVDWACWDDTYRFMQDINEEYVSTNLKPSALERLNVSTLALFTINDGLAASVGMTNEKQPAYQRFEAQRVYRRVAEKLMGSMEEVLTGIVMVNGTPHIFSARKIRDTAMVLPANGVLIMARAIDGRFIATVAHDTLLKFSVTPVVTYEYESALANAETGYKIAANHGVLTTYSIVDDAFGNAAFCLKLDTDRGIMVLGRQMFVQNFLLVVVSGITLLIAFVIFTEKKILRRILSIERQAQHIGKSSKSMRNITISGDDEIFDLSVNINSMIDTLKSNEKFLQQTLDTLQAGVITISPDTHNILSINAFAEEFIGLPRDEIVGKPCHGFICPKGAADCPVADCNARPELLVGSLMQADGTQKTIVKSVRAIEVNGEKIFLETFIDITDLEKTRQELHRSEERYKTLFMNTGTASAVMSSNGLIFLINTEFSHLVGLPPEEIEEKLFISQFLKEDLRNTRRRPGESAPRHSKKFETSITSSTGKKIDVLVSHAIVPDSGLSIVSLLDISDRKAMEDELSYRANHDLLTGLANKTLLDERLREAMGLARNNGRMVGLLLIDLDRFKQVNDSFGHSLGDKLLRQASERLTYLARKDDCVARTGGDEFIVMTGDVSDRTQLEYMAKNIMYSLNRCFYIEDYSIYLSASIGIACFPDDGDTTETLMQSADLAMYQSKDRGKNTYTFFAEDFNVAVNSRMALETALFKAMEENALEVYFQPKVDVSSAKVVGCEALVRWKNEKGVYVPPSVFIPLAEETGLVKRLDMFVLHNACRQLRAWEDAGCNADVHLAVNMSARSILSDGFMEEITEILRRERVTPEQIGVEITETAFMSDLTQASSIISKLSDAGIRIFLDDFGTGYSSLYYLHTMPIACLKIDKRFIDGINAEEGNSDELVKTIITLAEGLGMTTVAEGVETREQLDFLRANGCSVIQGYIFSPALSGADFAAFLADQQKRIVSVLR